MSLGVELSGRGDSLGGGDDIVGEVDQYTPGRLGRRDQLLGRDLAAHRPGDAFVPGLPLLDRDLRLPLGSHADDARRSGQDADPPAGVLEVDEQEMLSYQCQTRTGGAAMDLRLELVSVPVADVDRAKRSTSTRRLLSELIRNMK